MMFSGLLFLASAGGRWVFPLSAGVNIVPVLLFFLVDRKSDVRALAMGAVAGALAGFLSAGPALVWMSLYLAEAWCIGRLMRNQPRFGSVQYLLLWMVMGMDFGMGFLFRMILEYPLKTQLLEDWLAMDGVAAGSGMLILFVGQYFRPAGGHPSAKPHGVGIPLS